MGNRINFMNICLAKDPGAAVAAMDDEPLRNLSEYLDAHGHLEGFVGGVIGMVTVVAAQRFLGKDKRESLNDKEPARNVAEAMESGLRGEDMDGEKV